MNGLDVRKYRVDLANKLKRGLRGSCTRRKV